VVSIVRHLVSSASRSTAAVIVVVVVVHPRANPVPVVCSCIPSWARHTADVALSVQTIINRLRSDVQQCSVYTL